MFGGGRGWLGWGLGGVRRGVDQSFKVLLSFLPLGS